MHMPESNLEASANNEPEPSGKRLFGTIDPDYVSIPDTKRLKLLEEKGEEELCERVIKVVEKEFGSEITDTELQIEEIDSKLLKVQQYMHTLRFLGALEFFTLDQVKTTEPKRSNSPQKLLQDNHPAVRRYLTKNPPVSKILNNELPTAEDLSKKDKVQKEKESIENKASLEIKNEASSPPCLNKIIIPTQPESSAVISQGRKGRLQKKVRIVVGNTYQYLPDAQENGNQLKFKWRVYVRGPPENHDISSFVAAVIFTLDKSYSPHDVIKICEFPFTVSRRGWGEFKVHLKLTFHDPRNKPVKLLHSLRLSRQDDRLALTGLWRLGEETWYDVWLYDKTDTQVEDPSKTPNMSKEEYAKQLIETLNTSGIKTETLYSDTEGNMTLAHCKELNNTLSNPMKSNETIVHRPNDSICESDNNNKFGKSHIGPIQNKSDCYSELNLLASEQERTKLNCHVVKVSDALSPILMEKKNCDNQIINPQNSLSMVPKSSNSIVNKFLLANQSDINDTQGVKPIQKSVSVNNNNNIDKKGKNSCKILIRQADGKLVSVMVPKEMYEMALKLSSDKNQKPVVKKANPIEGALSNNAQNITSTESTVPPTHNINVNKTCGTMLNASSVVNKATSPNTTPLSSKTLVFKSNNIVPNNIRQPTIVPNNIRHPTIVSNNIRHPIIRMKAPNGLTNISIKQPTQALTLHVSSPNNGSFKFQTNNNVNSLRTGVQNPPSTLKFSCQNSSNPSINKIAANSLTVSKTPPKNARIIQTSDGSKFYVTSSVLTNKGMADNLKNITPCVKQIGPLVPPNNIKTHLVPLSKQVFNSKNPIVFNNKVVCKIPSTNTTNVICTSPSVLSPNQFKSNMSLPSTNSSAITTPVFSIKSSNIITQSTTTVKNTSRKIFITASPHLVKMDEVKAKTQFNTLKNVTIKSNVSTKQKKSSSFQKMAEKTKMEVCLQEYYENKIKDLKSLSASCSSVEEVVRLFMKNLALTESHINSPNDVSVCKTTTFNFDSAPIGKQRAMECWRAREIKKVLISRNLPGWESWNSKKIISWSRLQGFTPITSKGIFQKEAHSTGLEQHIKPLSSLTVIDDIKISDKGCDAKFTKPSLDDIIIVVDSDDDEKEINKALPIKDKDLPEEQEIIPVPTLDIVDGCHFVELELSKLRIKLDPEEAVPGVKMELAKNIMWKATLNLMEDLLRSSFSAAMKESLFLKMNAYDSQDSAVSPNILGSRSLTCPKDSEDVSSCHPTIGTEHVQIALANARPEFDLFTGYGMGKLTDAYQYRQRPPKDLK